MRSWLSAGVTAKNELPAGWTRRESSSQTSCAPGLPVSSLAYMLDTRRERTATEIMLFGWLNMRPLSNQEREYWNTHLLPSGCSIINMAL